MKTSFSFDDAPWQIVPKTMTRDMIHAVMKWIGVEKCWEAALAAAPSPPSAQAEAVGGDELFETWFEQLIAEGSMPRDWFEKWKGFARSGFNAALRLAPSAKAEAVSVEPTDETGEPIELNLSQVRQLEAFFGGEDTDATVQWFPAWKNAEGDMPAGLYVYCTEHPEEGRIWLNADEPLAPPAGRQSVEGEIAWLCEREGHSGLEYLRVNLSGLFDWTADVNEALRLCRKKDASAIASIEDDGWHVVEHMWVVK